MYDLNFRNTPIEMRDTVMSYIRGMSSSEYTFVTSFIWGADGKIALAEDGDVLYIRYTFPGFPMFMLAPLCRREEDCQKAIYRAERYLKNNGAKPLFKGITDANKDCFVEAGYAVREDRNNFDYIYNAGDLMNLTGKKYHGKRNHINRFMSENQFEYVKLDRSDAQTCLELQRKWAEEKGVSGGSIAGEAVALQRAFEYMDELGLIGGGIAINGQLCAFTMAELLSDEMAVIYFEKAADIQGLYPTINQQFVQHELSRVKYINREEDMGIEGLRKAKLSYHPAMLLTKYEAEKSE